MEQEILTEALKTSYEEAIKVLPSKQKITRTTVMNKVHQITENIKTEELTEKKNVKTLFIEADEDHVAEQHGRWIPAKDNKSFMSRLIYIYEYKQEMSGIKGKKELVNRHYFGGLYEGSKGIEKMWNEVNAFIEATYDVDELKRVYIVMIVFLTIFLTINILNINEEIYFIEDFMELVFPSLHKYVQYKS